MIIWNCYARNFFLGEVAANNGYAAIEVAIKTWRKFNILYGEISVIPKNRDRCRLRKSFSECTDYRVKYS